MNRYAVIAVALGATAALAACEKPNPGVTVWSGTNSQHEQAVCWSADPTQSIQAQGCAASIVAEAQAGGNVPVIPVVPGDVVGISVDPVVTDGGWFPVIGGQRLSETPITSTYWRFTFPELQTFPAEGLELRIQAAGEGADSLRGLWLFQLQP